MFSGESVTLVNRTAGKFRVLPDGQERGKRDLFVQFNGRQWKIKPGVNHGFPAEMVHFAKNQNPVMGTQHVNRPTKFDSLVGVQGKDICTPVEETDAIERLDRKTATGVGRHAVLVEGDPVSAFEARVADADAGFSGGEGFIDGASAADGVTDGMIADGVAGN